MTSSQMDENCPSTSESDLQSNDQKENSPNSVEPTQETSTSSPHRSNHKTPDIPSQLKSILRSTDAKSRRKSVIVNLDKNEIHEIPSLFDSRMETGEQEVNLGTRRPFEDDTGAASYIFELKHNHHDEQKCGAELIKFYNRDDKWSYGPIELFLRNNVAFTAGIPSLGIQFRISRRVDINRPNGESTCYEPSQGIITDERRRQDDNGIYKVENEVLTGRTEVVMGESDRSLDEDRQLMRLMNGVVEFVEFSDDGVTWTGFVEGNEDSVREIERYQLTALYNGRIRIRVSLIQGGEEVIINGNPSTETISIYHEHSHLTTLCCHLGKESKRRHKKLKRGSTKKIIKFF